MLQDGVVEFNFYVRFTIVTNCTKQLNPKNSFMKRSFIHSCKVLLLLLFFNAAGIHGTFAQQLSITGTITDSKHLAIAAASVQIKGTNQVPLPI
jgi:hypothetical protein